MALDLPGQGLVQVEWVVVPHGGQPHRAQDAFLGKQQVGCWHRGAEVVVCRPCEGA